MAWKNGFSTPKDKVENLKCTGLTQDKDNTNKFMLNFTWKYPANAKKARTEYSPTWMCGKGQWSEGVYTSSEKKNVKFGGSWHNWDGTGAAKNLYRSNWYPVTSAKLKEVWCRVYGHNEAGYGPLAASAKFKFEAPPAPSISEISYNSDNGNVSTHIKFKRNLRAKNDAYRVVWRRIIVDNFKIDKKTNKRIATTTKGGWSNSTSEDVTVSYAPSWAKGLSSSDKYAKVTWEAYVQGIAGDSKHVTRSHIYSWPLKPRLYDLVYNKKTKKDDIKKYAVSIDRANSMLIVGVRINYDAWLATYHPVDTVKLQYNNSTSYTKISQLGEIEWTDVEGMIDNANCSGFVAPYEDVKPAVGNQLWIRLETKHDDYIRHSDPYRVEDAYIAPPTASDDKCIILDKSATTADGEGVHLLVGCKSDGNTGTEVSWSTDSTAWKSNKQPETFEATWGTSANTDASTMANWPRYHDIYIKGLEEGEKYYFRARRYLEGNNKTYTGYSAKEFVPESTPTGVVLSVPDSLAAGKDLPISWTYESNKEQTQYNVFDPTNSNKSWVSGKDANGYALVPWKTINARAAYNNQEIMDSQGNVIKDSSNKDVLGHQPASKPRMATFQVKMKTGGGWANSDQETVSIYAQPTCDIVPTIDGVTFKRSPNGMVTMVSQGGEFTLNSSAKEMVASAAIIARGSIKTYPDGFEEHQAEGDVIWGTTYDSTNAIGDSASDAADDTELDPLSPEDDPIYYSGQLESKSFGVFECRLPDGISLIDGGIYELQVSITDTVSGLSSDVTSFQFLVDWAHKSVEPDVTITTDSGEMTAQIGVWKPEGASSSDVVDIYRVTPDGAYQIASGIQWGSLVTDRYVPFANSWGESLAYRLCTRTVDGDLRWDDFEYELFGYSLRFDWNGEETLTLPYNLKVSDKWEKGFEARKHLDGTYAGYFDGSVKRTASLSVDMAKSSSDGDKRRVRELANYPGPVFVRTPTGSAYVANIVPTDMTYEYNNPIVSVSFDAVEFKLIDEFMVSDTDIVQTGYLTYEAYLAQS